MKNTTKLIIMLILLFVVVLFAVINAQPVNINFIFAEKRVPLVLIIIISVIVGALIALIGTTSSIWKKNRAIKELEAKVHHHTQDETAHMDANSHYQIKDLEAQLKEKEIELSELRHNMVNQLIKENKEDDV